MDIAGSHSGAASSAARRCFFPVSGLGRALLLLVLFGAALALRVPSIGTVPMDVNPVKQYRSAMVARAMFYRATPGVPQWQAELAEANVRELGELAPPLTERIAATAYRMLGYEALWVPRLFSALAWVIGGIFLYLIALRVTNPDAALISAAFYLLLPAAVAESLSFQPDPPMVGVMLAGLYAVLLYDDSEGWGWLLTAATLSALAILFKGVAAFFLVGVFAGLQISRRGVRGLVSRHALVFLAVSIVPTAVFYARVIGANSIGEHTATGFVPHLLLTGSFYIDWLGMIRKTVGLAVFLGGLLGLLVVREGRARVFMFSLWFAYVVYGVVKTYHIHTHPYYQLPFIPILSLTLGATLAVIAGWLAEHRSAPLCRAAAAGIVALGFALNSGLEIRRIRTAPDFGDEIRVAEEIGRLVDHSSSTILLAEFSGRPLRYHGHFCGTYWPDLGEIESESVVGLPILTAAQRFATLFDTYEPEFFVVRDLEELGRQPDLEEFLRARFAVLASSPDYLIFDLRDVGRR